MGFKLCAITQIKQFCFDKTSSPEPILMLTSSMYVSGTSSKPKAGTSTLDHESLALWGSISTICGLEIGTPGNTATEQMDDL